MKIGKFQEQLRKEGIDAAIFYHLDSVGFNPNMLYFSGYRDVGFLIIPARKKPFLVVPRGELAKARKSIVKSAYVWGRKDSLLIWIKKKLAKLDIKHKTVGIDNGSFTIDVYKGLKKIFKRAKIKDISDICRNVRETKTDEEVKRIRTACRITSQIISKAIGRINRFKTENEAAKFLELETMKAGCLLAFSPIVASGKNACVPHHDSSGKMQKGFCVIDFGVKYKDYCSDCTRTVYIGRPGQKEIEIYNLLLGCQKGTTDFVSEGKKCKDVFDFANKTLGKYKKYFIHGLGHGLGIEIHEKPNMKPGVNDKIKADTCLTIEPGIYIPNKLGIRIEDTVLIRNNSKEILTTLPKDLIIIRKR